MLYTAKTFIIFIIFALTVIVFPAGLSAQDSSKLVARVGKIDIRQSNLDVLNELFGNDLSSIEPSQRDSFIFNFIINQALLANAAIADKLEQSESFDNILSLYRLRALHDIYYKKNIYDTIDEKEFEKYYNDSILASPKRDEVKARHILVETEKEAQDLLKRIEQGEDFANVAERYSKGPSKSSGGSLGFLPRGRTVAAFEKALFELKTGEVSKPVKTQFGWHIIKAEEKRKQDVPPLAEIKPAIRETLAQMELAKDIKRLKKIYVIEDLR